MLVHIPLSTKCVNLSDSSGVPLSIGKPMIDSRVRFISPTNFLSVLRLCPHVHAQQAKLTANVKHHERNSQPNRLEYHPLKEQPIITLS